jgi:hypothetical protein
MKGKDFKQLIKQKLGLRHDDFTVAYGSDILNDNQTLEDQDVQKSCTVALV